MRPPEMNEAKKAWNDEFPNLTIYTPAGETFQTESDLCRLIPPIGFAFFATAGLDTPKPAF